MRPGWSTRRTAVVTWTAAFGAGLAALLIHRRIPSLADPVSCPGALEIGGAIAARLAPAASLASILRIANAVFTVAGVAVTVRLLATAAESVVMGAAVGLAVASMWVLAPEMTVSPWLAIAAAAWAYAAIARPARDVAATESIAGRARAVAVAALMLSAAIAPPLAFPFAVIACG